MDDANPASSILIIEDDPDTIHLLSTILMPLASILFAKDGETGVRLAEQHQPDVIVLDQQMPGQSGQETCRILQANPATRECSIVFVTAHNRPGDEARAFELGARDFVSKPFSPVVVTARVRNQLLLKQQSDALREMANIDGLTGAFNRRYADHQLEHEIRRHQRQGLSLGVVLVDVDHFKAYNDHYGHQAGDDSLRAVAQALMASARRPGEFVARYGGEEFVVVLPHSDPDDMDRFGWRIIETVRALAIPHDQSPEYGQVTISAGLVAAVPGDFGVRDFLEASDQALYDAKQAGRNTYRTTSLEVT